MVGIEEVAARAGVSTSTVSRALSGRGYVAASTRSRIERVASQLGYVVSGNASSLVTGRTNTVGLLTPVVSTWFFSSIIEGVERALNQSGYDLLLYNFDKDSPTRKNIFEYQLVRKRVDGIIAVTIELQPSEIEHLVNLGKPLAGIGGPLPGVATFSINDIEAARLATSHLISLGHRKILHVGGESATEMDFHVHSKRRNGFVAAIADARIPPGTTAVINTSFDVRGGHDAAKHALADPRTRPTAIFAASDEMAVGVIVAAQALGISVPRDLSVIGIDGHPLSDVYGLTTVEQHPRSQGADAARSILARLSSPDSVEQLDHKDATTTLRVRSSTSAPMIG